MADQREVAITGLGAVTPLGRDVASLWEGLCAGRSGIDTISAFDASGLPVRIAGEVRGYTPHPSIAADRAPHIDRGALFALDAALQALADAGLEITAENARRAGVVIGSARPGDTSAWEGQRIFHERGAQALKAGYAPRTLANTPSTQVTGATGARGPALTVAAGGASGNTALALAAGMVRRGEVDIAIAGGSDAAITPPTMAAFAALTILSKRNDEPARASRPFDADADGMVMSEGAAMVVLESAGHARDRGARVYGRLAGSASITEPGAAIPGAEEAARVIRAALDGGALREIDFVCAYGSSMKPIDRLEMDALKQVFAEGAKRLVLSAPKSMLGYPLGAAGVVDAIVCMKAIETGVIPPTINLERPAEGCDLDCVTGQARRLAARSALCYAYGFGGHHVALCFAAP
jgi:3-oxoacyl-[acyl-carrier-protein] synthase II